MHNNAPDALFNDTRKHSECGWQTGIPVGEDGNFRAQVPGLVKWSMDGFLHVLAIEIGQGLRGPADNKKPLIRRARGITISYGKPRTFHKIGYYR